MQSEYSKVTRHNTDTENSLFFLNTSNKQSGNVKYTATGTFSDILSTKNKLGRKKFIQYNATYEMTTEVLICTCSYM